MNKMKLWPLAYLLLAACFGSAAVVGTIDSSPLIAVDGHTLPATIVDSATGASMQVTSGQLTTYSWKDDCNYTINFSTGKSATGSKLCVLGIVTQVSGGIVQMKVDAVDGGGPSGLHSYNFQTDPGKPCTCGRLCVNP